MEHLTEPELAGYCARGLEPVALLQVTDHLAECETCRAELRRMQTGTGAAELRQSFESHLPAERLQRFVEGGLDPGERTVAEQHITSCEDCASDVRNLREFANTLAAPPGKRKAGPFRGWWLAAVAAMLLVAVALGVRLRQRPAVVASVNDSGTRITLDSDGRLAGITGLSAEQTGYVLNALRGGPLTPLVNLSELRPPRGALMGKPGTVSFRLVAPVGSVVRSPSPELQWTAREPGAIYIVTLRNLASGQVVSSPPLHALAWTPREPLQRGAIYAWQVAASVDGREEVAPSPPNPQARFQVLDSSDAVRLDNLPMSHLVRAILYTHAGLLDEAQKEAEDLAKENPNSSVAEGLLQRIRSMRQISP